jgi:hypothetical protein
VPRYSKYTFKHYSLNLYEFVVQIGAIAPILQAQMLGMFKLIAQLVAVGFE